MNDTEKHYEHFFEILGLKPAAQRVLSDIVSHGLSTVADIAARLHMAKASVYDAIDSLLEKSLVNQYNDERGKTFGLSDTEQIVRVHEQKIEDLKHAQVSLLTYIKNHAKEDTVARPKIRFYSGLVGMKQAFIDMPWTKECSESYLMWPMQDMLDSLGEEFLHWHGKKRFTYNVVINAVQKHGDRKLQSEEFPWLENNLKKNLTRVRYLQKKADWKMSFWLYGDKCLFASGGTEKFAFTIHSKEFCDMMKLLWQTTWESALD